ncbi:non-ribosomal peptide synthetase family protein [Paenarthrobacter nitroguajacolicus]|uniref:non-ribosomal peptide synthetase family protein n=1 Tax=Paenarthrobacter nitroguajacolicus TaxID=211146 RepID=UPI003D1A822D
MLAKIHSSASLIDMLDRQVRLRPHALAVKDGLKELTFGELKQRSEIVALNLRKAQYSPAEDRIVGVLMEHSIDLIVTVWGILRAGYAYLPLEPDYPEERLVEMLEDSQASVVVSHRNLGNSLSGRLRSAVQMSDLQDLSQSIVKGPKLAGPALENLAYVIYTSGSTGRPKGVAIEHGSISHQIRWLESAGHLSPEAVVLHKTPISFDAAQWELLANAAGACIAVGQPGLYRDPDALIDAMSANSVTTLQAVPTLLRALVDTQRLATLTSLSHIFSGGEALSEVLAQDVLAEVPHARLTNLYGPTECTINVTSHTVTASRSRSGARTVPIGRLIPGCSFLIVDEGMIPVSEGESGELLVGGPQLARGYLHRPELTAERFVTVAGRGPQIYYRTGDIVSQDEDGLFRFEGRRDSQVKLHGHRIELDEVSHRIEEHPWVRRAATLVVEDSRTGRDSLVACVELDARRAALMDQGHHGSHHQSKVGRVQVRAQLSDPGVRTDDELRGNRRIALDNSAGTQNQRRRTFARKTYRHFDGGDVARDDIVGTLTERPGIVAPGDPSVLSLTQLGELLRWFGQFHSPERLLPKFSYASPGALYATQLFISVRNIPGIPDGTYYYHPIHHQLYESASYAGPVSQHARTGPQLTFHLLGRRDAIEGVYKVNVREVLELEAGHMVGMLEEALAEQGLSLRPAIFNDLLQVHLQPAGSDVYLGTFEVSPGHAGDFPEMVTYYVQSHGSGVQGLDPGLYKFRDGQLHEIGSLGIEPTHVIAINQEVFTRSSFGISMVTQAPGHWLEYIALGRALHRLQNNQSGLGLMSAGYSSKTGNPLPASVRLDWLLKGTGEVPGASYFALGGKVSQNQIDSEGMDEDKVHMRGPAEMIRDDLSRTLPHYMIPARTLVMDSLPLSPNGKVDLQSLRVGVQRETFRPTRRLVHPRSRTERWLAGLWSQFLNYKDVSAEDDFFAMGGDSLTAVSLVNRINKQRNASLKVQTLFRHSVLRELAAQVDAARQDDSRLIKLNTCTAGRAVFCWPGLGGSPMNLRALGALISERPLLGVQAWGINAAEEPFANINSMARADIDQILQVQPHGPYTLWGYSFGARVAFEVAWQLEQAGHVVDRLVLLCPGNPMIEGATSATQRTTSFSDAIYLRILYSVFAGTIRGEKVEQCLSEVHDEGSFVAFMAASMPRLESNVVRRIVRIVDRTFQFEYTFEELAGRKLNAKVAIIKAAGDDYSFLDAYPNYSAVTPYVRTLKGDHYSLLADDVDELVQAIGAIELDAPQDVKRISDDPPTPLDEADLVIL